MNHYLKYRFILYLGAAFLGLTSLSCASNNFFSESPLVADKQNLSKDYTLPDSVTVQAGRHYAHGKIYSFFLGKHYRDVWAAPVQARVLNLKQEGFEIEKVGGNLQTTSFTLVDKEGHRFALRSIDKDPAASLSPFLKHTIAASFLRDQTAALNPYAALVVAPLAEAAGLPHANPHLVYLPSDSATLGKYNSVAGDKVYLLEEKMDDKYWLRDESGSMSDIVSSKKLLKKRFKDSKYQVDGLAFAKARLFDLLLNDRDRHQGQWNWVEYKRKDQVLYKPIPKDRDQAFYKFAHGFLPHLFGRGLNYQKFTGFHDDYRNLHALMLKSRYIDQQFLSEVTEAQFDSIAKDMQHRLTDDVIDKAVRMFPEPVYKLTGERIAQSLKSRRNLLPDVANKYYKQLAKEVWVVGSDEKEKFIVERLDDERTAVSMFSAKDDQLIYHRIFFRKETQEIKLYGLAEDDEFKVSGKVNKGISVTIAGGMGQDEIEDTSEVAGWRKMTVVQDTKTGNKLKLGKECKDATSNSIHVHIFDREGF